MMKERVASAPGKVLLIGAYAVLEPGNVAYVTGINRKVYTKVAEQQDGITFEMPQFGVHETAKLETGKIVYSDTEGRTRSKLKFLQNATELTLRYLEEQGRRPDKNFCLSTLNEPGFTFDNGLSKSGLGSSSAGTVATVAALFSFNGLDAARNRKRINKIAQIAHYVAEEKISSGVSISAVSFGSQVYKRFSPRVVEQVPDRISDLIDTEWDYYVERIDFPPFETAIGFTGRSASAADLVNKVKDFKEKSPDVYFDLIKQLNTADQRCIAALGRLNTKRGPLQRGDKDVRQFKRDFDTGRLLTRRLGELSGSPIESAEFTASIDAAVTAGAIAAKLPGDGGGDCMVALCSSKQDRQRVYDTWKSLGIRPMEGIAIDSNARVHEERPQKFYALLDELDLQNF